MNNEFLDVRRRALEEEYFAKLNRALLERLRAQAAEAHAGLANEGDRPGEIDEDGCSVRLAEEAL